MELCRICGSYHRVAAQDYSFPKFEDIHPAYSAQGFLVTNEEHDLFKRFVGDLTFDNIASICSGGEMPMFLLLPRTNTQLIAVDHSYRALAATIIKLNLLVELGPEECRDLFVPPGQNSSYNNSVAINKAAKPFVEKLPQVLQKELAGADANGWRLFDSSNCIALRKEWFYADLKDLELTLKNLSKLRLVHGDFRDISSKGPFDLVYLSNAFEHQTRENKLLATFKDEIYDMVKPGGYILAAVGGVPGIPGFKLVKSAYGARSTWNHFFYQKEGGKEVNKRKAS